MPWVEALSEPQQLRRCIRDLIALSTLPVSWKDYDPRQVADSVGGALVSMLDAEFVYVAVPGRRNDPKVEVVRTRAADAGDRSGEIRAMLRDRGLAQSPGQFEVIGDP